MANLLPSVPEDIDMEVVDVIATRLAEKLGGSVINASLPAFVGDWVRKTAQHSQYIWQFSVPMTAASVMVTRWVLSPDGTMRLELDDTNGCTFWRGTFRPVADA